MRNFNSQALDVRNRYSDSVGKTDMYWGLFYLELDIPRGPYFENLTLADVAAMEFRVLDNILRRAFSSQFA